ncbi:hypothetical protein PM082_000619 [Neofusicoccum parvum]|uniref:Uncharacterized protein n=1 Tax=Neofusicoccum parvum TaxID=310453 RepID=A0ACB5SLX5_9PEZI|nr:hypothetical protein PM082_000619 [Neofusicoccum parvum]
MPTLADLPTELRQGILLAAVEQEDRLVQDAWPGTIMALLSVCKATRRDMPWVLNCWSPLWWLQRPAGLTGPTCLAVNGIQCGPKLARLCISIFHDAVVKNVKKADWALSYPHLVHPELVDAWICAVPRLPPGIATVLLDVTPAPGWMQEERPYQLKALVLDLRVARCFMNAHVNDISRLIERIHEHYAGKITINLTGKLSHKSDQFVAEVVNECLQKDIFVQYVGEYLRADQGSSIQIQHIVHDLAPKKLSPESYQALPKSL